MKFLDYAPIVFISALTGQRVIKLPDLIKRANDARNLRIPTAQLNKFFEEHLEQPRATIAGKSRMKVLYLTQAGIRPPNFVVFYGREDEAPFFLRAVSDQPAARDLRFFRDAYPRQAARTKALMGTRRFQRAVSAKDLLVVIR